MRIGIDARPIEENIITGVGEYTRNLILGLSKNGFQCILYHSKEHSNMPQGENIITRLIKPRNKYLFEQTGLLRELVSNPPDIYHATNNTGVPLLYKGTSVLTIHDLIPITKKDYFRESFSPFISKKAFLTSVKIASHKAKRVIAISKTTKKAIVKKLGIPKNKIRVIYPGVSIPQTISSNTIDKLNLKGESFILNNGGIDRRKNLKRLIKSIKLVKKIFPDIKLVITGENVPQREALERLTKKMKLEKNIIFTGFISKKGLWAIIQKSEFICYPSENEGFGLPIAEAIESDKAIILSKIPVFRELANDFALFINSGSYLSIAKGIIKLKKDKNFKESLIKSSSIKKGFFSWEKTINETINLYREIA